MEIKRDSNINVRKTVTKAVNNDMEFHFFGDELTENNYMPTYEGLADEKYTYDEINDEFFDFINRKISENGVYLRICYLTGEIAGDEAVFHIEIAGESLTFKTSDADDVQVVEMYGIKITDSQIILGTTVDGGCGQTPYFAEFGSKKGNESYLSLDNPLNKFIISLMNEFLDNV